MGMDMYLRRAHDKRELADDGVYWDYVRNDDNEDEEEMRMGEAWYARKWWDLHNAMSFIEKDYECGEYIRLTRKNVEEMLKYACHHRDYWNSFKSVPELCEILDRWDEMEEAGLHIFYEADW